MGLDVETGTAGLTYPIARNYPPAFEKIVGPYTLPKDKGAQSYIGIIEKLASQRISPTNYKILDKEGFQTDPKMIRYAQNKSARISIFAELQKKKEFVPAPSQYSPSNFKKVIGNYKQ